MSYVTVIWTAIGACSLVLACMYATAWAYDRKARASLAFAVEALAIVMTVVVELEMMHASTPEEWGEWVRWAQIPIFLRTAGLLAFIWYYFETGRAWLLWLLIGSRVVILVAGFLIDPNFNFERIDSIEQVPFRLVANHGADARTAVQQPLGGEDLQRFPHHGPAHAVQFAKIAFPGKHAADRVTL